MSLVRRALARLNRPPASGARAGGLPAALLDLARSGAAPLVGGGPRGDRRLHIATLIPPFRRGSGGHSTIVNLLRELAARGHETSLWLEDHDGSHRDQPAARVSASFAEFFGDGPRLGVGFESWDGADMVLATGWQTVPRALLLPGAAARAYLVQDHEPEFYGASAEALLAAWTYRQGLHCIAASPWLAGLLRSRYGARASHFDLGIDHTVYRPGSTPRRSDLVAFYARSATPRRAVPLGLLALEELARRRPSLEIVLFGEPSLPAIRFAHTDAGVLAPSRLAALYGEASVGLAFSLTNPSLVGLEMLACGLPCLELDLPATRATFGTAGAPRLVAPEPLGICAEIERLLDDAAGRSALSETALTVARSRTWAAAADQLEAGLRAALQRD